eukprot:CAMPEP_0196583432 /NCGR_PEP_ID=MMETSP1081-20130531/43599_1 /TAXON_ID=36882 /ORGANISM="Pyramimonas amylifera, Strain CCMP720" /LENGTH=301 /DNA_ID=CAMNT_0041904327 /DNA_START=114 /DNA_END=1016 /DNA_ORIENTATION=+
MAQGFFSNNAGLQLLSMIKPNFESQTQNKAPQSLYPVTGVCVAQLGPSADSNQAGMQLMSLLGVMKNLSEQNALQCSTAPILEVSVSEQEKADGQVLKSRAAYIISDDLEDADEHIVFQGKNTGIFFKHSSRQPQENAKLDSSYGICSSTKSNVAPSAPFNSLGQQKIKASPPGFKKASVEACKYKLVQQTRRTLPLRAKERFAKGPDGTIGFHAGRTAAGLPLVPVIGSGVLIVNQSVASRVVSHKENTEVAKSPRSSIHVSTNVANELQVAPVSPQTWRRSPLKLCANNSRLRDESNTW